MSDRNDHDHRDQKGNVMGQSSQANGLGAPSAPHQSQRDFNRGGLIALLGSIAFTMAYFVYVAFLSGGVNLKEIAPEGKGAASQPAASNAVLPIAAEEDKDPDVSANKEPWLATPELIAHGRHVFKTTCALCHGAQGRGDGPAGASLNPHPRNLVEGKWKRGGTSLGLYDVLSNGLPPSAMASYGYMPPIDRWALVAYIRSITDNKVADDVAALKAKAPGLK
jgi:mono/diheme cytochrome c family protein